MYDNTEIIKFVDKLEDSFVLTGSEVVHIRNVHHIANVDFCKYSSYFYTEIHIIVDATSYSLQDNNLIKDEIQSLYLTINSSEVIRATKENVAVLLVDKCLLVRTAIEDYYKMAS